MDLLLAYAGVALVNFLAVRTTPPADNFEISQLFRTVAQSRPTPPAGTPGADWDPNQEQMGPFRDYGPPGAPVRCRVMHTSRKILA